MARTRLWRGHLYSENHPDALLTLPRARVVNSHARFGLNRPERLLTAADGTSRTTHHFDRRSCGPPRGKRGPLRLAHRARRIRPVSFLNKWRLSRGQHDTRYDARL